MWVVKDVQDLVESLKHQRSLSEARRDDKDNRQKDTAFYKGQVNAFNLAIELAEALAISLNQNKE